MNDFTDLNILGFFFLTWSLTFITAVKYPLNYVFGGLYIIIGLFLLLKEFPEKKKGVVLK